MTFKNSCDGYYTSMDVRFTKACDNSCQFCIEKQGLDNLGKPNVKKMIDSVKNMIQKFLT
jgi:2-iminoacetate synthase ThiH